MYDYGQDALSRADDFWGTPSTPPAAAAINAAIGRAATTPIGCAGFTESEAWSPRSYGFWETNEPSRRGGLELPPVADDILLDILPVSTISSDRFGRPQIEPDEPSLRAWDRTSRETAEHLVSWVNESGTARDAIEKAIVGGSKSFERLAAEYDDRLARAGYDRFASDVQACDRRLTDLYGALQDAQGVLDELRSS
jgi:hypothetical protein